MATSEPNAMKRMIAATSSPAPSEPMLPVWALSIAWPASSTCVPFSRASAARSIISVATLIGNRALVLSSCTMANAVVPSAEIWPEPAVSHGVVDGDDVGELPNLLHERVDHRPDLGRGHAGVVVDDDRDGVARLSGESLVEQLDGGLGVGPGGQEVLLVLASERHRGEVDADQDDDPGHDDEATVSERPGGHSLQHGGPAFGSTRAVVLAGTRMKGRADAVLTAVSAPRQCAAWTLRS